VWRSIERDNDVGVKSFPSDDRMEWQDLRVGEADEVCRYPELSDRGPSRAEIDVMCGSLGPGCEGQMKAKDRGENRKPAERLGATDGCGIT
jgi:hypothetical protein